MTSIIDPTQPTTGQAYTQLVRDNFQAAYDEISTLQSEVAELQTIIGSVSNMTAIGRMLNVDLSIGGDQSIPLSVSGAYIIKDIYITSPTVITTGYLTICTGANATGTILMQSGVSIQWVNGIMHTYGGNLDTSSLTQTSLYLNMNGPSTAPAIASIYVIGFML